MRTEIPQREVDKESDVHDAEDWENRLPFPLSESETREKTLTEFPF
jgi:hypothetical protein